MLIIDYNDARYFYCSSSSLLLYLNSSFYFVLQMLCLLYVSLNKNKCYRYHKLSRKCFTLTYDILSVPQFDGEIINL